MLTMKKSCSIIMYENIEKKERLYMRTPPEYPRDTQLSRRRAPQRTKRAPQRGERPYQYTNRRRKRNNNNITLIIIFCILMAGLLGALFGWMMSSMKKSNQTGNLQEAINVVENDISATTSPTAPPAKKTSSIPEPSVGKNDLIDVVAQARLDGMTKHCYLTFDDGPSSKVTGEVLDTLKKYDIKATFFEVGKNITKYPDIAKRVHNEGHLIANHSYNHDYNKLYATEQSFKDEIEKAEKTIKDITGEQKVFKLVRFPGGSYNAGDHAAEKQIYKNTLAKMGYYYCDWNTLNGDAEGKEKNKTELVEFFKTSAAEFVKQDKNLIVLMHDSDAKQASADSLENIIIYLKDNGYTFHRLDDIEP